MKKVNGIYVGEDEPIGNDENQTTPEERDFPVIDEAAFYGPLGDITRKIIPVTEADSVAILGQLLVGFGNIVGRSPFYTVEASDHHSNLFVCLVGRSSKGRKGTSLNHLLRIFKAVDQAWAAEQVATGMSSGEGLIWAVRDPIFRPERDKKTGVVSEVKMDNGIDDKRLLVTETEFAQPLKVMSRPTNILSVTIRNAWDSGNLRTLVKNDPARATDAHVSIVGHITQEELKRELAQCELFNGFANRFLWLVVKRSKTLPDGAMLSSDVLTAIVQKLGEMIKAAKTISEMKRSLKARAHWHAIYENLSEEGNGLMGAVTNRAEAQTLRLSMIYALADGKDVIGLEHLKAAQAFWKYSKDSAQYLFGDRLADPNAQKILDALSTRPKGMTRKEIFDEVFQRNISSAVQDYALSTLESLRFAYRIPEQTGGRPAERWFHEKYRPTP